MNLIGLIVRCKNEPYVTEFVNYYIKQGIDKIYIIDDNSNKEIYKRVKIILPFYKKKPCLNLNNYKRISVFIYNKIVQFINK